MEQKLNDTESIAKLYPAAKAKYKGLEESKQREMYEKLSAIDEKLANVFAQEEE